jgi:hypothetical protein
MFAPFQGKKNEGKKIYYLCEWKPVNGEVFEPTYEVRHTVYCVVRAPSQRITRSAGRIHLISARVTASQLIDLFFCVQPEENIMAKELIAEFEAKLTKMKGRRQRKPAAAAATPAAADAGAASTAAAAAPSAAEPVSSQPASSQPMPSQPVSTQASQLTQAARSSDAPSSTPPTAAAAPSPAATAAIAAAIPVESAAIGVLVEGEDADVDAPMFIGGAVATLASPSPMAVVAAAKVAPLLAPLLSTAADAAAEMLAATAMPTELPLAATAMVDDLSEQQQQQPPQSSGLGVDIIPDVQEVSSSSTRVCER